MIDIDRLKADFRRKCGERGIDPREGANSFQVVDHNTALAKATHAARMAALVIAHAERRPLCYDNGYGQADDVTVQERASRSWWAREHFWVGGARLVTLRYCPTPYEEVLMNGQMQAPVEVEAVRTIKQEAKVLEAAHSARRRAVYWQQWRALVIETMREERLKQG